MSHVRVSREQAEPQTWLSECDKCWHRVGNDYDWGRRNWALARRQCAPSSTKICVSRTSVPFLCRTSWETRFHYHVWTGSIVSVNHCHRECYQFDLESKWQSVEWRSQSSPDPKSRLQKSMMALSIMNLFLCEHRILQGSFKTVTSMYPQSLGGVAQDWSMDVAATYNTPVHCVIRVHQFLAQRNLPVLVHCTPLIWYQQIYLWFFAWRPS